MDFSDSDIENDPYQPVFQEEKLNISNSSEYFNNGVELENLNDFVEERDIFKDYIEERENSNDGVEERKTFNQGVQESKIFNDCVEERKKLYDCGERT